MPFRSKMLVSAALALGLACSAGGAALARLEQPTDSLLGLYAANRTDGIANYVTPDLALVSYALLQQRAIAKLEFERVLPRLAALLDGLHAKLADTDTADPVARANRDYVALLHALLNGEGTCTEVCGDELALVLAAAQVTTSPLFGRTLDYTQFKPRGRYAGEPTSERLFRAMRYAGSVWFAVQPSAATGIDASEAERQAAQAVALAGLIDADAALREVRAELDHLLTWQFGPVEDLVDADLLTVAGDAGMPREQLAPALLAYAREHARQPEIIDAVVDESRLEQGLTIADAVTGWRLLPSRYNADAAAFQHLVFDRTGQFVGGDAQPFGLEVINGRAVKGFPLADEILAALGSPVALQRLDAAGETAFEGYAEAMAEARRSLADASGAAGLQRLVLRAGLAQGADAAPHRLASLRAFWTWQKYLDVLYTKQSYTIGSKTIALARPRPVQPRPGADLESATALYTALALAARQRPDAENKAWQGFAALMDRLVALSFQRELGAALTTDDEAFLNDLDKTLAGLTGGPDRPIVIDVHTEPNSQQVVQEATGWPLAVTVGTARGAYLTHHEFKQPMRDRLTVRQWRETLHARHAAQEVHDAR